MQDNMQPKLFSLAYGCQILVVQKYVKEGKIEQKKENLIWALCKYQVVVPFVPERSLTILLFTTTRQKPFTPI